MVWIIGGVIVAIVIFMVNTDLYKEIANAKSINKNNLSKIMEESGAEGIEFRSHNNSCAAILDKESEKLHVFYSEFQSPSNNHHTYRHFSCNFSDIIESEVIVDNNTITKTARGSQIGGAVVGGALLGGVGAIIGGLSGTKGSFDQVMQAEIKLTINDLENPICKINFLDGQDENHKRQKRGYHRNDIQYKKAMEQLDKWQGMFDVILNNQNR